MEILQTLNFIAKIWSALTAENELLTNILVIPFYIIEPLINMLLFTTVLNIKSTNKQKILYVTCVFILGIISGLFISKPYGTYINMILNFILIFVIFKTSILKTIIAEILPMILIVILETIIIKFYSTYLSISYPNTLYTPINRISIISCIYLILFLLYKLVKKLNFNIAFLDKITFKNRTLLIINSIMGILAIAIQFYLVNFYIDTVPIFITILNLLSILAYFIISIFSLIKTTKLELTTLDLEETKLYNQSLIILHDSVRGFKHDFHNILQAIGGYIDENDMDGLNKYYSQLVADCQRVNNLTSLNPETINNPAIYGILASKYLKADELGIQINLEVFLNLNKLNMKIYEFTRILGILMDNAIEASSKCDEKIIKVEIRNDFKVNRQVLIIENTYTDKDVNTEKIFEKGYTSKTDTKNPHGLGLWEVRQILKKNNNLNLFTSKNDKFFKQQLEIYKNI